MRSERNKELYNSLCNDTSIYVPIFNQVSWLNSVAEFWDAVVVLNEDDKVVAGLPFQVKSRYGFSAVNMPKLTPYFSILYIHDKYKDSNTILELLIKALPKVQYYNLIFDHDFNRIGPWKWDGFELLTRYTFHLTELKNYESNLRGHINSAMKVYQIVEHEDIRGHFDLVQDSFIKKGLKTSLTFEEVNKIYYENKEKIKLYGAKSEEGKMDASLMLLMDNKYGYNILSGKKVDAKRGAVALITDHAIKYTLEQGLIFDFEGSSDEAIYSFYQSFNGDLKHVTMVNKIPNRIIKFFFHLIKRLG